MRHVRLPFAGLAFLLAAALLASSAAAQTAVRFRTQTTLPTGGIPADVVVVDLNHDDELDLVVSNFDAGTVSVLLGSPSGEFVPVDDQPSALAPSEIQPADYDKDGNIDLVVSETESDFIYFMKGRGDGTFENPITSPSGHDPAGLAAVDMNEDGTLDIVTSLAAEAGGRVNVLLGDGTGRFALDEENLGRRLPAGCFSIAVADLNGDDNLDVVAVTLDGTLSVLLGDGTGAIARPTLLDIGEQPFAVALADLNGDQKLDAVVSDAGASQLVVLHGDGAGAFTKVASYPAGNGINTVEVVDLDGDQRLDVLAANNAGGDVSIFTGQPDGSFSRPRNFSTPLRTYGAASGDFNHDGRRDIVAVHSDPSAADVLFGRPGGYEAIESLVEVASAAGLAVGDLTGDAIPDLVASSGAAGEIALLAATPATGGFGTRQTIAANVKSGPLRLADLNHDGRLDVITSDIEQPDLFVILATAGGFATPVRYEIAGAAQSIALGDFDGDGHLDAAAAVSNAQTISLWFGVGDGTLTAGTPLSVTGKVTGLAVGDFNRDGRADLVAGSITESRAALLLGQADRGFDATHTLDTGGVPFAVAVADADADGFDDVMALVGNQFRAFFGAADVAFTPGQRLNAAGLTVSLRDVTGDRLPDAIVANQINNAVAVLANKGARTFASAVGYTVGLRPQEVVAGDFDRDGRYDLVARGSGTWALTNANDAPAASAGDANGDGTLSAADLVPLAAALASAPTQAVERAAHLLETATTGIDFTGDGVVDQLDLPPLLRGLFR
ncbi:MAG: VCBS repeat-containing protein [Deltaproteobacteria bacterium]|nr:VCBS repeat-containing protein [Deltaproteobacteria bacterium]